MKDTKSILQKILNINNTFIEGLPPSAVNVGCDVAKLYPSVDNDMGMEAVENNLERYPNPDGLPKEFIIELGTICVEENSCEFKERFYCPNTGTATGPPHACDYVDIFMGELDKVVVDKLVERGVDTTDWTLYRDDGWMIALNGLEDIPVIEDILQTLHPNIKWEVNVRGPGVPHQVKTDGTIVDMSVLHHLDLKIHIIDGKIETDLYANYVPNYISRRSCHPPNLFPGILKSIGIRLRTNCSLDTFLDNRIEEYTRYLLASGYKREEVDKMMEETKAMDRREMIYRPRRRIGGVGTNQKKFPLISKYDPRQPNIKEGLKLLEEILYLNEENREVFPKGAIIAGLEDNKTLGR